MGIDFHTARFLLTATTDWGINLGSTATIGHQHFLVTEAQLQNLEEEFNLAWATPELSNARGKFADPFLRCLGARAIASLDASPYEAADIIHDMNQPIPSEWIEKFDTVFDGGSLEHIFNFPTAVRNCMQMTRIGGHFIGASPANGWCGHGFYQFSPELYFRVFSAANGFRVRRAMMYDSSGRWYEVEDPAQLCQRVELSAPTLRILFIFLAQRIADAPLFEMAPQQSDYSRVWRGEKLAENAASPSESSLKKIVKPGILVTERLFPAVRRMTNKIRDYRYRRTVAQQTIRGLYAPQLKRVESPRQAQPPTA
ncbi:MAG: hypothetical protein ABSD20_19715 [Terriglobales bacterium]|jgi:hypothetical protein